MFTGGEKDGVQYALDQLERMHDGASILKDSWAELGKASSITGSIALSVILHGPTCQNEDMAQTFNHARNTASAALLGYMDARKNGLEAAAVANLIAQSTDYPVPAWVAEELGVE